MTAPDSPAVEDAVWLVPHLRNPDFTGRNDLLDRLFTSLAPDSGSTGLKAQALSGLGGVGKTQVAIEFAYRHRAKFQAVFWVSADNEETLRDGLATIAYRLRLVDPAQPPATAVAVPVVPQVAAKAKPAAAPRPSDGVPRHLAVFNHKGGTGKTTTAVSVAAGLAAKGKKVLLVDTDAQGNVGVSFNESHERTLYHVLVMGLRVADAVKTVRPNLDLLSSNETLAAAELYLAGRQNRDRVLRERLSSALDAYDYVVLDCSPSLSLMNQNALVYADSVIVPVSCDYLSLVGVKQVLKTLRNVRELLKHDVDIVGVLPTFYDARNRVARDAVEALRKHFGDKCLPPIRVNTRLREAPTAKQSIFEYDPECHGATDYRQLVQHVLSVAQRRGQAGRVLRRRPYCGRAPTVH